MSGTNNAPAVKKFPIELFGHSYTDTRKIASDAIKQQYCHFIKDECKKPRKSEPHIKIGICSVGYKGSFVETASPVIICPHRLAEKIVFDTVREHYLKHWDVEPEWVTEVGMGVGGNVDHVAVKRNKSGAIDDFLCVEFQAAGTTGSPWPAVLEHKKHGKYLSDSYNYGINWANEFMKTMMQQVYKKGKIITHWNRKIVFVVQDLAIQYIKSAVDTQDLRPANAKDDIHFVTFSMVWNNNQWVLTPGPRYSTDLDGINKLLGGSHSENFPTANEFMRNIQSKGNRDGVF